MLPKERKKKKPWWADLAEYKRPKKKKDDMKYLLLLLYMLSKSGKKKSGGRGMGRARQHRAYLKKQYSFSGAKQRCTIKMSYGNDRKSSVDFLTRYMQQIDKDDVADKPELFSDEPVTKDSLEKTLGTVDDRFYRFIISPEKNGIDLELLTRTLVKKMEGQLGFRFRWYGAVHKNTAHHHVHLWIDGTDRDGKKIERIPRALVTQDLRFMAQEIITTQLGYRTKAEQQAQIENMYRANRMTKLDRDIERREKMLPAVLGGRWMFSVRAESTGDRKRLENLENLELARRHESVPDVWYLEKDWTEKLQAANNNNSFFKARKKLVHVKPENMELYTDTEPIRGVITAVINPDWEDTWKGAYVVENTALGKAWFVPVPGNRAPDETLYNVPVTVVNKMNSNGFKYPVVFRQDKKKEIGR